MKQSNKLVTVACVGAVLEWAEFTFYAHIAATISLLFFPSMNHQAGIVAAFVIFAIGYLMQLPYAFADATLCAPIFRIVNQLFPPSVRYTGASFSWSVSMAIFGGTAPLVSTWLQSVTSLSYAPAIYIVLGGVTGLFGLSYASKLFEQDYQLCSKNDGTQSSILNIQLPS